MRCAASYQTSVTLFTPTPRQQGRPLHKKAAEQSTELREIAVNNYTGQPSNAKSSQRARETARVHMILRISPSDVADRRAGPTFTVRTQKHTHAGCELIRAHLVHHDGRTERYTCTRTVKYQQVRKRTSKRASLEQWCYNYSIYASQEGTHDRRKDRPYRLVHAPSTGDR